jgi:hypothetical protein
MDQPLSCTAFDEKRRSCLKWKVTTVSRRSLFLQAGIVCWTETGLMRPVTALLLHKASCFWHSFDPAIAAHPILDRILDSCILEGHLRSRPLLLSTSQRLGLCTALHDRYFTQVFAPKDGFTTQSVCNPTD